WFQQKRLGPSYTCSVTPGSEDSVTWHYATGEVRQIIEGRPFSSHNHVGHKRILSMYVGMSLDRSNNWHSNVRQVLEYLHSLVVHLAPNAGIGDIAERRKIDSQDELSACSRKDNDLVCSILRNPVEGVHKFCMILSRKGQRTAIGMT